MKTPKEREAWIREQVLLGMGSARYRLAALHANNYWDYSAIRPDGAKIVVLCTSTAGPPLEPAKHASKIPEGAAEGWVVYENRRRRDRGGEVEEPIAYGKLRMLTVRQLAFQMGYEAGSRAFSDARRKVPAHDIGAHRTSLLANARALRVILEEEISRVKDQRPNSPEAAKQRDDLQARFEGLLDRVIRLEEAVKNFSALKPATVKTVERKATSLGKFLDEWLKRSGPAILDQAAASTVAVLMATALCVMLDVKPDTAAWVSAGVALGGGQAKKAAKKGARLIQNT